MPSAIMVRVEDAHERILARIPVLEPVSRPLIEALGRVLVEDIVAQFNVPLVATSAMDLHTLLAISSSTGASLERAMALTLVGGADADYVPKVAAGHGTTGRIITVAPTPRGRRSSCL